jgi:hypothetical protein
MEEDGYWSQSNKADEASKYMTIHLDHMLKEANELWFGTSEVDKKVIGGRNTKPPCKPAQERDLTTWTVRELVEYLRLHQIAYKNKRKEELVKLVQSCER